MLKGKINIAIVHNQLLFAEALQFLFSDYDFINKVNIYTDATYFMQTSKDDYDIVLCDVLLKSGDAFDFFQIHKKRGSKARIIFLTAITENAAIKYAIRNGASGYISPAASFLELVDAVIAVYNKEVYIEEGLRHSYVRNSGKEAKGMFALSPREKEVIRHICGGKTIKESAQHLNLRESTVQTYYKTIRKKLNLRRTADLIAFSIKNGLYQPGIRA